MSYELFRTANDFIFYIVVGVALIAAIMKMRSKKKDDKK